MRLDLGAHGKQRSGERRATFDEVDLGALHSTTAMNQIKRVEKDMTKADVGTSFFLALQHSGRAPGPMRTGKLSCRYTPKQDSRVNLLETTRVLNTNMSWGMS